MLYTDDLLGTLSDCEVAKLTNKNVGWIWSRRTKLRIAPHGKRIPKYKIDVFKEINNESAYWLGYYFADGCVCYTTDNRYIVTVTSTDKELVDNLCIFYGINTSRNDDVKKFQPNGKPVYTLDLCNKELFDDLVSLGCIEQKSLTVGPPQIDDEFICPFLLGLFDGDGSISLNKSINQWKVSIGTGSKLLYEWLYEQIIKMKLIVNTEIRTTSAGNNFYNVTLIGNMGRIFLDKLYSFNIKSLSRKKDKFLEMSKIKSWKGPKFQDWEIDIMRSKGTYKEKTKLINSHPNNCGWIRSEGTVQHEISRLKHEFD